MNPFEQVARGVKPADEWEVTNDAYPYDKTVSPHKIGKYHDLFTKLKPGKRIKCKPEDVCTIQNSLRGWLKRRGIKGRIKTVTHHPDDGMGGIWFFKGDKKK